MPSAERGNDSAELLRPVTHPLHFSPEAVREAAGYKLASYSLALEAWRRGLTVTALDGTLRRFSVSDGDRTVRFDKSRPSLTTRAAIRIEQDKSQASRRLAAAGVPIPGSETLDLAATTDAQVIARAEEKGFPVVVKPSRGSMGRGVYTGIQDAETLSLYLKVMRDDIGAESILLERHIDGEDYRILVIGERAVAVCHRIPANVVGDGRRTIAEHIEAKNRHRAVNPYLKPIVRDAEIDAYVREAGHDYDTVLADGHHLRLRGKANASSGGDSHDVTGHVPEALTDAAVRAVRAVPGLEMAGVDLLWSPGPDGTLGDHAVIELNSRAEIDLHMYPWEGPAQDMPKAMIDHLFPDSPRAESSGDEMLIWPLTRVLDLIRDDVASSVEIAAVPAHRYRHRRHHRVSGAVPWGRRERGRLRHAVKKLGVAGSLRATATADGTVKSELIVCGPRWAVRSFTAHAAKVLGVDWGSGEPWKGPVTPGFDLPPPIP